MDLSLLPPFVHVVVVVPGGDAAAASAASADPKPRGICDSGRTQIDGASTVTGHSQSVLHRRRDVGTLSRSSGGGDRGDMVVTCWPAAMRVMWWQVLSSIRAAGAGGDLSADDDNDGTADGAAAEVDGPL